MSMMTSLNLLQSGVLRVATLDDVLLLVCGNLDEESARQVMQLLDTLTRQAQKNLILVTHSSEAAAVADRTLTLRDGKLENGTDHG